MTADYKGNRVCADGASNGTHRLRASYRFSDFAVGFCLPKGNLGNLLPDGPLELRATHLDSEVKRLALAFEIVSEPADLVPVREALQSAGIDYESADSSFLPSMSIPLDAEGAAKVFELIDAIEELDDVQNVYSNFDVSDEVMASLG